MARSKNLSLSIANIFKLAKSNKWIVEYDDELDHLYWIKPKISKTAKLKKFLDDFSLYIMPSGDIQGMFIEYAKYNFIAHNKEYGELLKKMRKTGDDNYVLPTKNEKGAEHLLKCMANQISNETLEAIGEGLDLDKVLKAT